MTATAYTDAVKRFNKAYETWNHLEIDPPPEYRKRVLDELIEASAACIETCPIANDRVWYEEKHMMAVRRRADCA